MSDGRRIFITGPSGSGKSTVMNQIIAPASHLIVFDYLPTRRETARKMRLAEVDTLKGVKAAMAKGYKAGFRLWYRPPPENQAEALHALSMLLFQAQSPIEKGKAVPPITLAVDEMSEAFPIMNLPQGQRGFYRVSKAGRHYRITVVGGTQRPAQVNTEYRGNAEVRYIFGTTEPVDLKAIEEMGGRGTPFGRELARVAQSLPRYHYIRLEAGRVSRGVTKP